MLDKKEDALMRAIFSFATSKGGCCIIRPIDILTLIPYNIEFKASELHSILSVLEMDDYIENVVTDKKGESYYCITLKKKGHAFKRSIDVERRQKRDKILFKVAMIVGGGIAAYLFRTYIIPLIFN